MPRLFLIDGSSQMYRAYHAIRGLTGPDGKSTNAVYGFVTMLRKLINDHQPQYIAASFDLAGPTFRDDIVTDYKANRAPMPGDLAEQAHDHPPDGIGVIPRQPHRDKACGDYPHRDEVRHEKPYDRQDREHAEQSWRLRKPEGSQ